MAGAGAGEPSAAWEFRAGRAADTVAGPPPAAPDPDLIDRVVRAQVHRTVNALAYDTALADLVRRGRLGIVGAYYDLDTGIVTRLHAVGC